ncbi:8531_t:CDS:1, partial [Cetraspora pellucida]
KNEFEDQELEDRIYKLSKLEEPDENFDEDNRYFRNAIKNKLDVEET